MNPVKNFVKTKNNQLVVQVNMLSRRARATSLQGLSSIVDHYKLNAI